MWSYLLARCASSVFPALFLLLLSCQLLADPAPFVERQRQARLVHEDAETMVIDEFRWGRVEAPEGKGLKPFFQRTTIHPDEVAEVYWWSENFPPKWIAAHGQLVFVMKDQGAIRGADGQQSIGMVLSVEAHLREGQSYSFLTGLLPKRSYGVIYMLTTLEDRVQRAVHLFGHSMDTYRLKLSDRQKRDLLRIAVRSAARERLDEAYHTTRRSCITEALRLLNQVLPEQQQVRLWTIPKVLANLSVVYPKTTPVVLMGKGLAERSSRFDESVRELRYPTASGQDYVVDVKAMPGSGIPRELLALEQALFRFGQEVASRRVLEKLQAITVAGDPRLLEVHQEMRRVEEALEEAGEDVLDLASASPGLAVRFLVRQELPEGEEIHWLRRSLLRRLHLGIHQGTWVPSPEEGAALERLASQ